MNKVDVEKIIWVIGMIICMILIDTFPFYSILGILYGIIMGKHFTEKGWFLKWIRKDK